MLSSARQNNIAYDTQMTGIQMAAFCLRGKTEELNNESQGLRKALDPYVYRRSHCVLIQ